MKRVFLSSSFGPQDRELVHDVEQFLASHSIPVVTGRRVGGGQLTDVIMNRIASCDGLVALLTRGDRLQSGEFISHPWVYDEYTHARSLDKRAVAMIETSVQVKGAWASHERIDYDRSNPLPAFLRLSDVVGEWKRAAGRTVKIQLLPLEVTKGLLRAKKATCKYRLVSSGVAGKWIEVLPIPEPGAMSVWISGVQDEDLIQLAVELPKSRWESPAASQWMPIELTKV